MRREWINKGKRGMYTTRALNVLSWENVSAAFSAHQVKKVSIKFLSNLCRDCLSRTDELENCETDPRVTVLQSSANLITKVFVHFISELGE